jgi:hypothetical protein
MKQFESFGSCLRELWFQTPALGPTDARQPTQQLISGMFMSAELTCPRGVDLAGFELHKRVSSGSAACASKLRRLLR